MQATASTPLHGWLMRMHRWTNQEQSECQPVASLREHFKMFHSLKTTNNISQCNKDPRFELWTFWEVGHQWVFPELAVSVSVIYDLGVIILSSCRFLSPSNSTVYNLQPWWPLTTTTTLELYLLCSAASAVSLSSKTPPICACPAFATLSISPLKSLRKSQSTRAEVVAGKILITLFFELRHL